MAKGKRVGKAHVSGYARYKTANKEVTNRVARLRKLAKENPNNLQLDLAIKNVVHRRHIPKSPYWSSSMIRVAQIVKSFTGKFDKGVFDKDPDKFAAACRIRNYNKFKNFKVTQPKGSMFSIGEQLGWKF